MLPIPTYKYIGRFHGSANADGTGGYGNHMRPIYAVWDHDTSTAASASISGWALTQSTIPAGIEFNYGAKQNFDTVIKYGVNGYHSDGNLKIYVDGVLKVDRDFAARTDYVPEVFQFEAKHFQTVKFMLHGEVGGLGPHPNFKIYEIYPKTNLAGATGSVAKKEFCSIE